MRDYLETLYGATGDGAIAVRIPIYSFRLLRRHCPCTECGGEKR